LTSDETSDIIAIVNKFFLKQSERKTGLIENSISKKLQFILLTSTINIVSPTTFLSIYFNKKTKERRNYFANGFKNSLDEAKKDATQFVGRASQTRVWNAQRSKA